MSDELKICQDDEPGKGKGKSGQQKGKENLEAVRAYVKKLEELGKGLPSYRGKPNLNAIALECGFDRGVWRDNHAARLVIEQAMKDIGLDTQKLSQGGRLEHVQKLLDQRTRREQKLEEMLALARAENEPLRQRVKGLEERLRRYEAFEEVMVTTGRRLIP